MTCLTLNPEPEPGPPTLSPKPPTLNPKPVRPPRGRPVPSHATASRAAFCRSSLTKPDFYLSRWSNSKIGFPYLPAHDPSGGVPAAGGPARACPPLAPAFVRHLPRQGHPPGFASSRRPQQYFARVIGCAQERDGTGASTNRIRSRERLLTVRATPDHPPLSACCPASLTGQGDLSHRSRIVRAPPLLPSSSVTGQCPAHQQSARVPQHSQAAPGSPASFAARPTPEFLRPQPLLYGPAPPGSSARLRQLRITARGEGQAFATLPVRVVPLQALAGLVLARIVVPCQGPLCLSAYLPSWLLLRDGFTQAASNRPCPSRQR